MPRLLKESEAWLEIARRLEVGPSPLYLCSNIGGLRDDRLIADGLAREMSNRVYDHLATPHEGANGWAFFRTDDDEARPVRVLAALFLSYEASEEEGK